ncbi:hypothetical protein [Sediminitomix flava]|uniref:Uncharacterized protein n=1 Tax=Sediminitomix flava TaxID=379075 RepID=A0A315Z987_SEDFL|nr:hypothetical protein [Sediminitomix flava]PWJ41960.1 hypothetical protein BC781_103210 [Sediminitomix flava]
MNNTFEFKRFRDFSVREFSFNKQFLLMAITAVFFFVIVALFAIRELSVSPLAKNDLVPMFIMSYLVLGVVWINRSFLPFRNREKLINFLTLPASQFEKFLFEYLSKVVFGLVGIPAIILLAYVIEGEVHKLINYDINYSGLSFLNEIFGISAKAPEQRVLIRVFAVGFPWTVLNILFVGNSVFTKFPIVKTTLFMGVYILLHVFIFYQVLEVWDMGRFIGQNPNFILSDKLTAMKLVIGYFLLTNVVLVYCSYLKLQEKVL